MIVPPQSEISYGERVFGDKNAKKPNDCANLIYTSAMFRTTGTLCDSFAEHLNECDAQSLAWVWIYQSGTHWRTALQPYLNEDTVPLILLTIVKKFGDPAQKEAATAAAALAKEACYRRFLCAEDIRMLRQALRENGLEALAGTLADETA